jgi:hypothetical protein
MGFSSSGSWIKLQTRRENYTTSLLDLKKIIKHIILGYDFDVVLTYKEYLRASSNSIIAAWLPHL